MEEGGGLPDKAQAQHVVAWIRVGGGLEEAIYPDKGYATSLPVSGVPACCPKAGHRRTGLVPA